jgi:hypothetical protein
LALISGLAVLCAIALLMAAVGGDSVEAPAKIANPEHASQPAAAADGNFEGRVLETMNGGGYTYVLVTDGERQLWAAAPETQIEVGADVSISLAMKMQDFHSDALDRDFDAVYFVAGLGQQAGSVMPKKTKAPASTPAVEIGSVSKLEGGYTVAELYAEGSSLAGQEVALRGVVVKVNEGIMSRNWLHVRDGSGDEASATHDLILTSAMSAAVGDLIVVRGTLGVDRDFGSGYSYALIVESAELSPGE